MPLAGNEQHCWCSQCCCWWRWWLPCLSIAIETKSMFRLSTIKAIPAVYSTGFWCFFSKHFLHEIVMICDRSFPCFGWQTTWIAAVFTPIIFHYELCNSMSLLLGWFYLVNILLLNALWVRRTWDSQTSNLWPSMSSPFMIEYHGGFYNGGF